MTRCSLLFAALAALTPTTVAQSCASANLTGGPRIPTNLQGSWVGPFDVPEFGVSGTTELTLPNDSYVKFQPLIVYIDGVEQAGIALPATFDCVNPGASSVSVNPVTGQVNVSTTDSAAIPLLNRPRHQCLSFMPVVVNGSVVGLRSAQYNGSFCTATVPNVSAPLVDVVVYTPYTASGACGVAVVRTAARDARTRGQWANASHAHTTRPLASARGSMFFPHAQLAPAAGVVVPCNGGRRCGAACRRHVKELHCCSRRACALPTGSMITSRDGYNAVVCLSCLGLEQCSETSDYAARMRKRTR